MSEAVPKPPLAINSGDLPTFTFTLAAT